MIYGGIYGIYDFHDSKECILALRLYAWKDMHGSMWMDGQSFDQIMNTLSVLIDRTHDDLYL